MNAVDFVDVDVAFKTESGVIKALNHVNLHIQSGKWCAVIGENGSGKSTLAKVISNLSPISRGKLLIMGEDPRNAEFSRVQMVFQNPEAQMIGETVFEDIAFGLSIQNIPTDDMKDTVLSILTQFGIQDWIDKSVSILSGGQKQLLCIASCVALKPDVIVFDECTSMLDEGARQMVRKATRLLVESGKTVIWITHHLDELADADEVVVVKQGQIRYQGSPQSFYYEHPSDEQDSWCRHLGFTPPYIVQIAECLRENHGWSWFKPLTTSELLQGEQKQCLSR